MGLNITSSLITAETPSNTRSKSMITMDSKINTNAAVVADQAKENYQNILGNYKTLNSLFKNMANLFSQAKAITTGSLKNKCGKSVTACTNQGQYCLDRSKDLQNLFKYGQLESRIAQLEAVLEQANKDTGK